MFTARTHIDRSAALLALSASLFAPPNAELAHIRLSTALFHIKDHHPFINQPGKFIILSFRQRTRLSIPKVHPSKLGKSFVLAHLIRQCESHARVQEIRVHRERLRIRRIHTGNFFSVFFREKSILFWRDYTAFVG